MMSTPTAQPQPQGAGRDFHPPNVFRDAPFIKPQNRSSLFIPGILFFLMLSDMHFLISKILTSESVNKLF
jgi:hypothetical protein